MGQTRLNVAQLKTLGHDDVATDSEVEIAIDEHSKNLNAHPQYLSASLSPAIEKVVNKGVPGGYVPLDMNGYIPVSSIPTQSVVNIIQTSGMDGGEY
jgi:hypothetical protein